MKKIFLALALAASVFTVSAEAQVKSVAAAKAAVEKAEKPTTNPKKNVKPDVWIKYGKALLDANGAPAGNLWVGMSRQEVQLVGFRAAPLSESQIEVNGETLVKVVYDELNLYFNAAGQLQVIEVTKPVVENAIDLAYDAYAKAAELDTDSKKVKDITEGLRQVNAKYTDEAYNAYSLGDANAASVYFEKAAKAAATAPLSQLDSNSVYNAAFTAWGADNLDRAKKLFIEGIEAGYAGVDGESYAKLADIATRQSNPTEAKNFLEDGFKAFPNSQSILVGLINYYISSNEDPERLFVLLDEAKKNEPNNVSLYYVEGNINKQLGKGDAAVAAYRKCAEINPEYEFGYIGEGIYWYDLAVELQTKASEEMDDAKYMALLGEFEAALKNCIAPFESAFEVTKDNEIKVSVAEYLKNAAFRFREDADYQAKYDKYDKYIIENAQ